MELKNMILCICMLILFQYLLLMLVAFDTLDHTIHLECLFLFLFLYLANSIYQCQLHTPSIAFRHLLPNSARFSYATEGVLFISAQLSSDTVSTLQKVPVLI